jgi:hypothetical protein
MSFDTLWMGKNTSSKSPDLAKERFGGMGKLGKEVKRAVNKAAKSEGSSGGKKKSKKGSGSGADKAKRAAKEILK